MRNSETNKEDEHSGNYITDENETFVRFRGTLHATEELRHEIDCLNVFHIYTAFRHVRRLFLRNKILVFSEVHVKIRCFQCPKAVFISTPNFLFS